METLFTPTAEEIELLKKNRSFQPTPEEMETILRNREISTEAATAATSTLHPTLPKCSKKQKSS